MKLVGLCSYRSYHQGGPSNGVRVTIVQVLRWVMFVQVLSRRVNENAMLLSLRALNRWLYLRCCENYCFALQLKQVQVRQVLKMESAIFEKVWTGGKVRARVTYLTTESILFGSQHGLCFKFSRVADE